MSFKETSESFSLEHKISSSSSYKVSNVNEIFLNLINGQEVFTKEEVTCFNNFCIYFTNINFEEVQLEEFHPNFWDKEQFTLNDLAFLLNFYEDYLENNDWVRFLVSKNQQLIQSTVTNEEFKQLEKSFRLLEESTINQDDWQKNLDQLLLLRGERLSIKEELKSYEDSYNKVLSRRRDCVIEEEVQRHEEVYEWLLEREGRKWRLSNDEKEYLNNFFQWHFFIKFDTRVNEEIQSSLIEFEKQLTNVLNKEAFTSLKHLLESKKVDWSREVKELIYFVYQYLEVIKEDVSRVIDSSEDLSKRITEEEYLEVENFYQLNGKDTQLIQQEFSKVRVTKVLDWFFKKLRVELTKDEVNLIRKFIKEQVKELIERRVQVDQVTRNFVKSLSRNLGKREVERLIFWVTITRMNPFITSNLVNLFKSFLEEVQEERKRYIQPIEGKIEWYRNILEWSLDKINKKLTDQEVDQLKEFYLSYPKKIIGKEFDDTARKSTENLFILCRNFNSNVDLKTFSKFEYNYLIKLLNCLKIFFKKKIKRLFGSLNTNQLWDLVKFCLIGITNQDIKSLKDSYNQALIERNEEEISDCKIKQLKDFYEESQKIRNKNTQSINQVIEQLRELNIQSLLEKDPSITEEGIEYLDNRCKEFLCKKVEDGFTEKEKEEYEKLSQVKSIQSIINSPLSTRWSWWIDSDIFFYRWLSRKVDTCIDVHYKRLLDFCVLLSSNRSIQLSNEEVETLIGFYEYSLYPVEELTSNEVKWLITFFKRTLTTGNYLLNKKDGNQLRKLFKSSVDSKEVNELKISKEELHQVSNTWEKFLLEENNKHLKFLSILLLNVISKVYGEDIEDYIKKLINENIKRLTINYEIRVSAIHVNSDNKLIIEKIKETFEFSSWINFIKTLIKNAEVIVDLLLDTRKSIMDDCPNSDRLIINRIIEDFEKIKDWWCIELVIEDLLKIRDWLYSIKLNIEDSEKIFDLVNSIPRVELVIEDFKKTKDQLLNLVDKTRSIELSIKNIKEEVLEFNKESVTEIIQKIVVLIKTIQETQETFITIIQKTFITLISKIELVIKDFESIKDQPYSLIDDEVYDIELSNVNELVTYYKKCVDKVHDIKLLVPVESWKELRSLDAWLSKKFLILQLFYKQELIRKNSSYFVLEVGGGARQFLLKENNLKVLKFEQELPIINKKFKQFFNQLKRDDYWTDSSVDQVINLYELLYRNCFYLKDLSIERCCDFYKWCWLEKRGKPLVLEDIERLKQLFNHKSLNIEESKFWRVPSFLTTQIKKKKEIGTLSSKELLILKEQNKIKLNIKCIKEQVRKLKKKKLNQEEKNILDKQDQSKLDLGNYNKKLKEVEKRIDNLEKQDDKKDMWDMLRNLQKKIVIGWRQSQSSPWMMIGISTILLLFFYIILQSLLKPYFQYPYLVEY